jgi:hypothetical protein
MPIFGIFPLEIGLHLYWTIKDYRLLQICFMGLFGASGAIAFSLLVLWWIGSIF